MLQTPPPEGPLYNIGDEIYTIDREGTLYYYFQGNRDYNAKVKQELRYKRNLWDKNAQIGIRIPIITQYKASAFPNPYSGLGHIELGYSYSTKTPTFDHSLEIRAALPTISNNVETPDTELKGFYTMKWKFRNLAINYLNEYDQTIFIPPGYGWTSYYEGKLTAPDFPIEKGVKISGIYNFRVLFDSNGLYKSAAGATMFGSMGDVALSLTDTWGIGGNGLWRFKFEANLSARF